MAQHSLSDRLHQFAFAVLYPWAARLARLTGRRSDAAAIAVWYRGRLLVVKHSYMNGETLPGGHIGNDEAPALAAARELAEEVGIVIAPAAVKFFGRLELRHTRLSLFECQLSLAPKIKIDNREITEAAFTDPAAISDPSLILRRYFHARLQAS